MPSRQLLQSNPRPKTSIILLATTLSVAAIILLAILCFLYYLWYSLVHRPRTSPFDASTALHKLQRFSYKELKNATHSFSESNSIGKGGSGTVFRGIRKDGKLVAVKLLDPASLQSQQEFQSELNILGGLKSCPLVVSLLGFCVEKEKRLLVYEYMANRSLQESLFLDDGDDENDSDLSLTWGMRFSIILDVAKALTFLHHECHPPVIHGDVKPSNVLLDSEFRAKISDFGLSRLKLEGEFGVDMFSQELGRSQELWKSQELSGNSGGGGEDETQTTGTPDEIHGNSQVDFSLALQASSSSQNSSKIVHNMRGSMLSSVNYSGNSRVEKNDQEGYDKSFNHNDEDNNNNGLDSNDAEVGDEKNSYVRGSKQLGEDWWWRQDLDGSGELCSKDYVKGWIGSQVHLLANPHWNEEDKEERENIDDSMRFDKFVDAKEYPLQEPGIEFSYHDFEKEEERLKPKSKKHRKMHEWWEEEHLDELSKKNNALKVKSTKRFKMPHFGLGKCFHLRERGFDYENHYLDDPSTEFSFRKGWMKKKKKNSRSFTGEMQSGDPFSRELSSTTSMRGTLCYVAPEYSGTGYLMEKGDIYSFGVLILVIVSGRRPLHILSSPMTLDKANLVSWCRHLAYEGNILELMDERLKDDYDKDQASLCINLALACIQRKPEMRPDMKNVLKILQGEMGLSSIPFERSPSPTSKLSRSRKKKQRKV